MAKYKIRNSKVFKQIFEVSIKTFCRKWEGETLPNDFHFLSNLKNAKTNTILKT